MPIKIPKNFVRRRSSGNVLESIENPPGQEPPVHSFRVLDRQDHENSSFDGGNKLKRMSAIRPRLPAQLKKNTSYADRDPSGSNRGSEGTQSGSIVRGDDTSGSARHSYASTTPSSIDYDSPPENGVDSLKSPIQSRKREPMAEQAPTASSGFSIKAAGRSFAFTPARRKANSLATSNESSDLADQPRERSVTESSYASTATPPKLDFGNDLGWVDTEFGGGLGDLLNSYDQQNKGAEYGLPDSRGIARTESEPVLASDSRFNAPPRGSSISPIHSRFGPTRPVDSSPFSMASMDSHDRLMSPPVPRHGNYSDRSPLQRTDSIQADQAEDDLVRGNNQWAPRTTSRDGFRAPRSPRDLPNDLNQGSRWNSAPKSSKVATDEDESLFDAPRTTVKARQNVEPVLENKASRAMTQAEFEHYRATASTNEEEDEEDETYEDDDEADRLRQAAKQRRRQEAQLAVYRQQMKKVTGETPTDLPATRPGLDHRATQSTSKLPISGSSSQDWFGLNSPKPSDDEDDEDVPLGVLQAHGFPSNTRPPTRMKSFSSVNNLRSPSQMTTYPPPAGSTRNDATAGGGGSVPVFARRLPADLDPYIGASLVNPANRSSLALNAQPSHQPNLPAGGLVGIIDAEQRDKLTRRGSPNTQGTYSPLSTPMPNLQIPQAMPRTMSMGNMSHPQMGMPYGMQHQPASPSEQAQMQMTNSFAQMMQMQMAMMQQMMGMQGISPQQQQQFLIQQQQQMAMLQQHQPQAQSQYGFSPGDPRFSMASQASAQAPFADQRRPSTMSPSVLPQQAWAGKYGGLSSPSMPNLNYAASIAPSERSNVGQPSRYRPVTSMGLNNAAQPQGQHSRTSTMTTQTVQHALNRPRQQGVAGFQPPDSVALHRSSEPLPHSTIRAVSRPKYTNVGGGRGSDEEDDEEGWKAMQVKKEARKSRWRRNRDADDAPEGAYYYEGSELS